VSQARLENNIKMDYIKIGCDDVDWFHLAQSTDQWQDLMNMVIILQVV
jgi:hypothetical protein